MQEHFWKIQDGRLFVDLPRTGTHDINHIFVVKDNICSVLS